MGRVAIGGSARHRVVAKHEGRGSRCEGWGDHRVRTAVFGSAEFVVLASGSARAERLLERHAPVLRQRGVICTDVGGVKQPIVDLATRLGLGEAFAGSHPLVEGQGGGFASARPRGLRDGLVYVTPVPDGDRAADEVRDFWKRTLGSHPVTLPANRHDANARSM